MSPRYLAAVLVSSAALGAEVFAHPGRVCDLTGLWRAVEGDSHPYSCTQTGRAVVFTFEGVSLHWQKTTGASTYRSVDPQPVRAEVLLRHLANIAPHSTPGHRRVFFSARCCLLMLRWLLSAVSLEQQ